MSRRGLKCQKQYGKFTDRSTVTFIFPCDDDTRHAAFASSLRISKTKELTNLPKHQCVRGEQGRYVCVCVCISREQIFTAASSQDQRKHSSKSETILRDFKPTHERSLSC